MADLDIAEIDIDLGFLSDDDSPGSFDLNHFAERTEDLYSFNTLLVANNQPDLQVLAFTCDSDLAIYIKTNFPEDSVQTIVKNQHEESKAMCPYFRVIMNGFSENAPTNFLLQDLYKRMGISSLSSRCVSAMIIGLTTLTHLECPISVPHCFMTTTIDASDFIVEEDEIDLACLATCDKKSHPEAMDLCDIAGMTLPYYLPPEVHVHILKYLQSPTASLIQLAMETICFTWDLFLYPMFLQREPRIPCHIASYFNASTVQSTAADATRPFLVKPAPRPGLNAFPTWMASS